MNTEELKTYAKSKLKSPEHINEVKRRGFVEIDFDDPHEYEIADNSIDSIIEKFKVMEEGVKELSNEDIDVNPVGFDSQFRKLSKLGSQDVGKLIKVRGFINATGTIRPMFEEAQFKCRKCGHNTPVTQDDPFKLIPPLECQEVNHGKHKCGCMKFDLDLENSRYRDSQKVSIQEVPEDVTGQVPVSKDVLILKRSLLNRVRTGDKANIIGIVKVKPYLSSQTSKFGDTYVEALNIMVLRKDVEVTELTKDDVDKVRELAKQPNIYKELIYNIAPSLHGLTDEKESCLLALVGGVPKNLGDINRRDCIHVLLVGDPSVGKSQLLKSISTLAPLGYYSLGKGTSTAGLTAAVLKDDKGEYLIFAGVMVLTDKGVACIDEIDKMNPEDRVAMHEAMEQQTVTINKANIHATLMARTTVVSAANPILGRYDPNKNIADNIKNLPATLLSRFDLIFIIVDTAEKERDELLVSHILEESESRQRIDRNLIKNYIIVAKSYSPVMTIEAKKVIKKFYLESRERQSASDPIPITARQLESLVRMAEAHAKLSFKDKVEIEDAEAAIRLLSLSLRQTCKFQTSGADIDNTEAPKNYQAKETVIMDIIETAGTISEDDFREHCLKKGIMVEDADKIAMHLSNRGRINKTFYPSGWSSLHQP